LAQLEEDGYVDGLEFSRREAVHCAEKDGSILTFFVIEMKIKWRSVVSLVKYGKCPKNFFSPVTLCIELLTTYIRVKTKIFHNGDL
jgi:hypothetical protein